MYFSNSHPSLDFPTPAGPLTTTSRGTRRSTRGVEQLLHRAQFGVAAGQRCFQPVDSLRPAEAGKHPNREPQLLRLGLAFQMCSPASSKPTRGRRKPPGRGIDKNGPSARGGLHSRRGVDRVAGDHAFTGRADRDGDLARDDARPARRVRAHRDRRPIDRPRRRRRAQREQRAPRRSPPLPAHPTPPSPRRR